MTSNPLDQARIKDDVIRYEYAERLFDILRAKHNELLEARMGEDDRLDGLSEAMNLLDEEMERLQSKWG